MSSPEFGSMQHGLGRIEAKLDNIDIKIDGHSERLAVHDVRITQVEQGQTALRGYLADGQQHKASGRQLMTASLVSGGSGALLSGIITWLSLHH